MYYTCYYCLCSHLYIALEQLIPDLGNIKRELEYESEDGIP